jgi:hypothetical protein
MVNLVPLVDSTLPYAMPQRPLYAAPAVEAALSILETLGNAHEMGVTDLEEARPGQELRLPVVEEVRHSHAGDYRSSPVGSDANVPWKGWGLACGLGGVLSADRDPR